MATEERVDIPPGAIALAKLTIGLGIAGLLLWLSPWGLETLFKGLVLPLLLLLAVAASLGLAGRGAIDWYNSTTSANMRKQFIEAITRVNAEKAETASA